MTKYFVDAGGKYLGGFDGTTPPAGAIEVPFAPDHALDTWDGTKYVVHPPTAEEIAQAARDRDRAKPDTTPVTIGMMKEWKFL